MAAFGVSITQDARFIAVTAAMRPNITNFFNGTQTWTDAILVARLHETTGAILDSNFGPGAVAPKFLGSVFAMKAYFFRVEGGLPSGGRHYR